MPFNESTAISLLNGQGDIRVHYEGRLKRVFLASMRRNADGTLSDDVESVIMMQCRSSRHHGAVIPVKKYSGGIHLKTTHELLTKPSNLQCTICKKYVSSAVTGPQKKQNMMIVAQRVSHPPSPAPPL